MKVYFCAIVGIVAGNIFGQYQLERWGIKDKWRFWLLPLGIITIFFPGAWLMRLYDYHILKIIRYWLLMYALLLLAVLDFKQWIIPNRALLLLLGIRTILLIPECVVFSQVGIELVISSLTGLFGGGLLFLIAGLIAKKGLGMGDVKLIAVVGYYLGFRVLMSDLVISLLMTVIGGLINLAVRKAALHSEMPFVPFMAAGTVITIFLGC